MTRAQNGLVLSALIWMICPPAGGQESTPRRQPGAEITLYAPEQHDLYDGKFVLSGKRIYQVGRLYDSDGWDHMGNDGSNVHAVGGSVEIAVNEIENTGRFVARLQLPEGHLVLAIDRFQEFNPCQDGGIAAYIYEHGDSGCGDTNWPKTFIYLAGWGYGRAELDGAELYQNYEMHFMVTQGMRDRKSLKVAYPMADKKSAAGKSIRPRSRSTSTSGARRQTSATILHGKSSTTSSLCK